MESISRSNGGLIREVAGSFECSDRERREDRCADGGGRMRGLTLVLGEGREKEKADSGPSGGFDKGGKSDKRNHPRGAMQESDNGGKCEGGKKV